MFRKGNVQLLALGPILKELLVKTKAPERSEWDTLIGVAAVYIA